MQINEPQSPGIVRKPKDTAIVVYDEDGRKRMNSQWRQKLWIDFDRDHKMDTIQFNNYDEVEEQEHDFAHEELRLDSKTITEDYLS